MKTHFEVLVLIVLGLTAGLTAGPVRAKSFEATRGYSEITHSYQDEDKNIWALGTRAGYLTVLKSQDLGQSWQNFANFCGEPECIGRGIFAQNQFVFIVGGRAPSNPFLQSSGILWRSQDGGETWQTIQVLPKGVLHQVVQLPSGRVVVAGLRFLGEFSTDWEKKAVILVSDNFGESFTEVYASTANYSELEDLILTPSGVSAVAHLTRFRGQASAPLVTLNSSDGSNWVTEPIAECTESDYISSNFRASSLGDFLWTQCDVQMSSFRWDSSTSKWTADFVGQIPEEWEWNNEPSEVVKTTHGYLAPITTYAADHTRLHQIVNLANNLALSKLPDGIFESKWGIVTQLLGLKDGALLAFSTDCLAMSKLGEPQQCRWVIRKSSDSGVTWKMMY